MGLSSLQLDAFFAAAKALNFSQAAEDLHITQSALSQRIKALEKDLDLTLFTRLPRGDFASYLPVHAGPRTRSHARR